MQGFVRHAIAVAAFAVAGAAQASGSILVSEPGADGFLINTGVFNGSSYTISKLTFDFSETTTADLSAIVIDGSPLSFVAPAGGTATFFGSGSVFGFDFTSFDTFDSFTFRWDPDTGLDPNYGAIALDFIGAKVTAETSNGQFYGVFEQVGSTPDVAAVLTPLAPVPEPGVYGLVAAGLGVVGLVARRRRQAQA